MAGQLSIVSVTRSRSTSSFTVEHSAKVPQVPPEGHCASSVHRVLGALLQTPTLLTTAALGQNSWVMLTQVPPGQPLSAAQSRALLLLQFPVDGQSLSALHRTMELRLHVPDPAPRGRGGSGSILWAPWQSPSQASPIPSRSASC